MANRLRLSVTFRRAVSVERAIESVLSRRGQIDILVNNAGIAGRAAPIWEQTEEDWSRTIAINLTGVFHFCRLVAPHMLSRKYGRIVNIASIAGKEGNPNMVPYSASKRRSLHLLSHSVKKSRPAAFA